jgi:hypothetical protein
MRDRWWVGPLAAVLIVAALSAHTATAASKPTTTTAPAPTTTTAPPTVPGYELLVQDFPIIGSNMHQLTLDCPAGKRPLGVASAIASGPEWNPSLIGSYGGPFSELTATGANVWAQAGSTSYNTVHVTLTCASA